MKKSLLFLTIIFLLVLTFQFVQSENAPGIDEAPLVGQIQQGQETYNNLSRDEAQTKYLEKEWTSWFRNSKYGKYIYKADPVFKFLFGMEFSFSWKFIAGFLLWTIFISLYYPVLRELFNSSISALVVALVMTSITSYFASPKILDFCATLIKNIWHNLILIFALIIIIVLVGRIMNQVTKTWHKKKEEARLKHAEKAAGVKTADLSDVKETLNKAEAVKKGFDEESKAN